MTLKQAIKEVESRPRNINLQWFISKWNTGYIIHCSSYMKRNSHIKFVYSTGDLGKVWKVVYDNERKVFTHIVKES